MIVALPGLFSYLFLVDETLLKSFGSKIKKSRLGGHFENLFFASSPEAKGQLT